LADIESLYDCLLGVHDGSTDESILEKYDEIRRRMWHEYVDVVSSDNLRRLNRDGAKTAIEEDPAVQMLLKSAQDPDLARKIQLVSAPSLPFIPKTHRYRVEMSYCMTSKGSTATSEYF
jgi:hypothetical protein